MRRSRNRRSGIFLSSNAQDFIEDRNVTSARSWRILFLSSNAQDFIEERPEETEDRSSVPIPEQ